MLKNVPQSQRNPNFSPRMNPLGLQPKPALNSGFAIPNYTPPPKIIESAAIPSEHLGMPATQPSAGPLPLGGGNGNHLGFPAGRGIRPLPGARPDLTGGDTGMQPQRAGLYGMPRRSMNMNAMSPMY